MATAVRIANPFSIFFPYPYSPSRHLHSHSKVINILSRRSSLLCLRSSSESLPSPVEVIGIGSRKDALIDFCLSNPMSSCSRLRFWTVHLGDSQKVQLLQRCHETEMILRDVEFPHSLASPPAIILVASAGFGTNHIAAMELLNSVKSAGGLAVAILLKPFSFEGQKRVDEADDLMDKLQKCSHLFIVVEADSLLRAEIETLAEALDSANNAVFLAMHTISILMSEVNLKILNTPNEQIKEVKSFEVLQLLETYGVAKVGFGAGYNLKSAITQAVFNCPFLSGDLKEFNGVILFTLTCSCAMDESDFASAIISLRQITGCIGDVIFSTIHEPSLEPNLIVATLLIVGCEERKVSQKKSFLSGLALHFPFLFSIFGKDFSEYSSSLSARPPSKTLEDAIVSGSTSLNLVDDILEVNVDEKESDPSRQSSYNGEKLGGDSSEISCDLVSENTYQANSGSRVQRDKDGNSYVGPGFNISQLWAKERAAFVGSGQIDMVEIFTLPVGVKFSSEMCSSRNVFSEAKLPETCSSMNTESLHAAFFSSRDAFSDSGPEALTEIYNNALKLLKGRNVDEPRKQGLLSERAASMLESERDLPRSWAPIMEFQYRGGIYRGRCRGGLPEGKGCLSLTDGSFYDGTWHNGKRSGLGTFCYNNGDVFQGAWRDDLMHGKGWFYFHTGDRWFANFWKGKANGEGRFYSNNGSIFFGFFRNGWRHGECICIDVDGSRWTEVWEEGVLVSRTLLEKGSEK